MKQKTGISICPALLAWLSAFAKRRKISRSAAVEKILAAAKKGGVK